MITSKMSLAQIMKIDCANYESSRYDIINTIIKGLTKRYEDGNDTLNGPIKNYEEGSTERWIYIPTRLPDLMLFQNLMKQAYEEKNLKRKYTLYDKAKKHLNDTNWAIASEFISAVLTDIIDHVRQLKTRPTKKR
jgi:hypothetical protein